MPNTIHVVGERDNRFGHEEADLSIINDINMMVNVGKYNIQALADDAVLLIYWYWKHRPAVDVKTK